MFNKQLKAAQKAEKKRLKEIEDAKSPEQKEYEQMQKDRQTEAEEYATEAKRHLLDLGYAYRPVISHIDPNRPDLVVASIVFVQVPFEQWAKVKEQAAANQQALEKAAEEAKNKMNSSEGAASEDVKDSQATEGAGEATEGEADNAGDVGARG